MNIPIIFIRPWHAELNVFCFIFNNTQIDIKIVYETEDSSVLSNKKISTIRYNWRIQKTSRFFYIILGLL